MAKKKVKRRMPASSPEEMVKKLAGRQIAPSVAAGESSAPSSVLGMSNEDPTRIPMDSASINLTPNDMDRGGKVSKITDPETGQELMLATVGDARIDNSGRKKKVKTKRQRMEAQTDAMVKRKMEEARIKERMQERRMIEGL